MALPPLPAATPTLHPVQSPQTRFCVLTVAPDTLPAIATMLIDVLFYSHRWVPGTGTRWWPLARCHPNCGDVAPQPHSQWLFKLWGVFGKLVLPSQACWGWGGGAAAMWVPWVLLPPWEVGAPR